MCSGSKYPPSAKKGNMLIPNLDYIKRTCHLIAGLAVAP